MKEPNKTSGAGPHPVGTGMGAAGGAVAGATLGTMVGGPVGTAVGGAVGAAAGALAGNAVAATIDPNKEDAYWRENYPTRHYFDRDRDYTEYAPAYRYGWESKVRAGDQSFDQNESELSKGWDKAKGSSRLTWDKAKAATRDAWHRVERAIPGDADNDGR